MRDMAHGKHRKEKDNKGAAIITTGALSLGAFAMASGSANAATEEEWDRVAKCESNGQWNLPGGDKDSTGGIQFRVASWNDALAYLRSKGVDTSGYPSLAYQATREQQIIAGEALLALQGPRAWSVTFNGGAHCGNAAAGALSSGSMFEGGPHPFGESDPTAPKEPAPEPSAPKPEPAKPKPAEGKDAETHTVVPGDTLYGITKAHTGDASHDNWKPLYEANRDVVGDNPHLIYPGQVLKLTGKAKPEAPAKPAPKGDAAALLDKLTVEPESDVDGYDRGKFGEYDRDAVLERDTRDGEFRSRFDGKSYADASEVDVDHAVSLKEAWDSGAHAWGADKRERFGSDMGNLHLMTDELNSSKGDKDAAEWLPTHDVRHFAEDVVRVKAKYGLSVDAAEKEALARVLAKPAAPKPEPKPKPEPAKPSVSYVSPIDAPVTQSYGNKSAGYSLGYHTGVDYGAPTGTPVRSVTNGKVVSANWEGPYGNSILVKHDDGTYGFYAHLSGYRVSAGESVKAGQTIGLVGNTGTNSSGPHLHFEIRVSPHFGAGNFLDPISWLRSKGA